MGQTIQNMPYEYDELARTCKTVEQRPDMSYVTTMEYDDCSRISRTVYPTGVALRYSYHHGRLKSLYDDDNHLLWRTDKTNAFGQLVDATLGNGDCKSPYSAPANCKFAGTGRSSPFFIFLHGLP